MMAKPTMAVPARAASTTLSAWRMCQAMRAASQAGLSPVSTRSCDIPASNAASATRAGSRRYWYTTLSIARIAWPEPQAAYVRSGERVKHVLNVVILLQPVDHGENLGRLVLRQLGRHAAQVLVLGRQRREAARFQRLLQPAEIGEGTADHQLRLALLAAALAHLLESVVDEVQLEIVLVDSRWVQAKHAHLAEQEADAAVGGEIATALGDDVAHGRDGASRIVGRGFHQQRHAVRRITLVQPLLVVGGVAPRGALDRRLDPVFRHVDGARVLDGPPQHRIGRRVGAAGLHRHGDVLRDAGELLRHAVPAREHRVLSDFENASHGEHGASSVPAVPAGTMTRGPRDDHLDETAERPRVDTLAVVASKERGS